MSRVLTDDIVVGARILENVSLQYPFPVASGEQKICASPCKGSSCNRAWWHRRKLPAASQWFYLFIFSLSVQGWSAQDGASLDQVESATPQNQLAVNWLYGAYIPKDAPVVSLNSDERYRLFVRQSFTTPGIYIKTGFSLCMIKSETTLPTGIPVLKA
jgi:hypothetical protein